MRDISKRFPGVLALDNVSLSIERGEVHALLGENGAGKSTLMKILSGAYKKDAGEIIFDGQPVQINSPRQAQELGVSIIYQELNLVPQLSVAENIFLSSLPMKTPRASTGSTSTATRRPLSIRWRWISTSEAGSAVSALRSSRWSRSQRH